MDKNFVANRIKELREEKRLTQYALATKAGVSPTYIYQLEKGEKSPTIDYLSYICNALNISISSFFDTENIGSNDEPFNSLNEDQRNLINEFIISIKNDT